jgi:aminobutyraldehyde dehydrogenase
MKFRRSRTFFDSSPALAVGNTVVIKPSEQTPLTTLKLAQLIAEIFPPGVVNVICGRGKSIGAPLIAQPQVRMIAITGDVSTGQKILDAAAQGLKRTHLELGGKAPVIVFDDADLESVVAVFHLYAGPRIYDRLVRDLTEAASTVKVGAQTEKGVEMGPLITTSQRSRAPRRSATWKLRPAARRCESPHGGFKRSGYGKDLSIHALKDYSVVRHVMVKH